MTHSLRLSTLADPALGFVMQIKVAENAIAGFSFATAWVDCGQTLLPVSGCGLTRKQSLDVMMMEAIERNSSVYLGSEPGTFPAVSLLDGHARNLPGEKVYLGHPNNSSRCPLDSSGCAAGDTIDDAALRGLLELIERDAFYRWWQRRSECPGLSYDGDALLGNIAESIKAEHRCLYFLDIGDNSPVPVVAALNTKQDGSQIYIGCAAALDQATAARRAAIESLSFWFWGKVSADPASRQAWLNHASLQNQSWLVPSEVRPGQSTNRETPNLVALLEKCRGAEIFPYRIDLTRPYFEIPVVRIVADALNAQPPNSAGLPYPSPL